MFDLLVRYRKYSILGLVVVAAVALLTAQQTRPGEGRAGRGHATTPPAQMAFARVHRGAASLWAGYRDWKHVRAEVARLRAETSRCGSAAAAGSARGRESAAPDAGDAPRAAAERTLGAEVVARDWNGFTGGARSTVGASTGRSWRRSSSPAASSAGSWCGAVSPRSCRSSPIPRPASAASCCARAPRDSSRASRATAADQAGRSEEALQPGDLVVTSGIGELFPKGLPLGRGCAPFTDRALPDRRARAGGGSDERRGGVLLRRGGGDLAAFPESGGMRLPLDVLAVIGAAIVQGTVVPAVGVADIAPDVPVVLTVLLALRYGSEAGCLTGFALGLAQDAVAGGSLGVQALSKALIGFVAGIAPLGARHAPDPSRRAGDRGHARGRAGPLRDPPALPLSRAARRDLDLRGRAAGAVQRSSAPRPLALTWPTGRLCRGTIRPGPSPSPATASPASRRRRHRIPRRRLAALEPASLRAGAWRPRTRTASASGPSRRRAASSSTATACRWWTTARPSRCR